MTVNLTSPPYRPLESRPEATSFTVRDLLQRIRGGKVRVPKFQRPLRWSRRQNLELLDSIWRGYPIGSLLLWKKAADADTISIGEAKLEAPQRDEALWVVDGQQRLTALAASLLDIKQPPGERRWELYLDVENPQFVEDPGEYRVPLSVLGDLRRLGQHIVRIAWHEDEKLVDAAEDAQQRILDYSIPVYIVDADNEEALRAIFARLNSTGARMRTEEVFHALFSGASSPRGLDLGRLSEASNRDGFGVLARSELLKMVLAMSGEDPTRRVEQLSADKLSNLVSEGEADEVISRVIAFLKDDAGIPHSRLVPYPVVFAILSRWFREFPEPSEWNRRRLSWWLWRGAATAVHLRAEVSKMREQLRLIEPDQESESLNRLLEAVGGYQPTAWRLAPFHGQSASSRIETLAMLSLGPLSVSEAEHTLLAEPEGPHLIDYRVLLDQPRIAREIYASPDWEDLDGSVKTLAKSGANRVMLERGHTGLQSQLRHLDPDHNHRILQSHLIDAPAFAALQSRDVGEFLRNRGASLENCVRNFLIHKCGNGEPSQLGPLTEYLESPSEND